MPPVWKGQFVQNFFVAQREVVSDTKVAVDGVKALDRKRPDPFACFQATDFHATRLPSALDKVIRLWVSAPRWVEEQRPWLWKKAGDKHMAQPCYG
jgi:hypothetical protein